MKIWGWKRAGGRASEPFEANKMSRHAGGRAGGYIWSQAGSSHLKAKWKWFIFCFSWRAARRLPASVCCVAQNKRLESGNCGGRGVGGAAAPTSAAQRDEGRRLKAGMTRLEMAPIRAALTLDPLSPLAAHRIFMLLGLSLPFQARGQLFTKDSDYASSINVSWKLNFIPAGSRSGPFFFFFLFRFEYSSAVILTLVLNTWFFFFLHLQLHPDKPCLPRPNPP